MRLTTRRLCKAASSALHPRPPPAGRSRSTCVRASPLQPGDVVQLQCEELAFGGEGLCKLPDGFVVFVPSALPGEALTARITQAKKGWARAAKLSTQHPHDHAADPPCPHFAACGGCTLQSLQYASQVAAKQRQVADLLTRVAGIPAAAPRMGPILPCEQEYHYRNKMEFSFAFHPTREQPQGGAGAPSSSSTSSSSSTTSSTAGGLVLGLHKPGSQQEVLPIASCALQTPAANEILAVAERLCRQQGLRARSPHGKGSALLEHLVIRKGSSTRSGGNGAKDRQGQEIGPRGEAEYLVNFVTSRDGRKELAPIAAALVRECAARISGVVNSVSQAGRPSAERRIAAEHVLHGRGHLTERLAGLTFEVSANSFFQVNTPQAEQLYALVAAAAQLHPGDTVLDLYCGAGTMTLMLARHCQAAWGVEVAPSAVRDAERNARLNGITNATFVRGQVERSLPQLPQPDVVVADPARGGMAPEVISFLRQCGARRLVYVSCNPATQARDIKALCDRGDAPGAPFALSRVQPVDMYPQTPHVETVAVLDRVEFVTL